jgi:hypothetical protein
MVRKSLAFGLLAGSCVAAAGGGAYIATWQHARSSAAVSAPVSQAVAPTPQPVGADAPAATTPPPQAVPSDPPPSANARPERRADARPSPGPAKKATENRGSARTQEEVPIVSSARPGDATSSGQGQPGQVASLPPASNTDPAPGTQRPWPGPPASATAPIPPVGAEAGRVDGDGAARDNVKLWEEVVVPTQSVLGLQLDSMLNSDSAQVEDRVDARVTRDVRVNGRVAIPSGSHVVGAVVLVERGGRIKDRARIGIRFNSLILADGTRMGIQTDTLYRESESPANKSSAKIGGGAIGGAIIGAIIGGGKGAAIGSGIGAAGGTAAAMSSDRMRVVLPAGTAVSVRTQAPIAVTVEK